MVREADCGRRAARTCGARRRGRAGRSATQSERQRFVHPVVVLQDLLAIEPCQVFRASLRALDQAVSADRTPELVDELKEHVCRKIGTLARPDQILFAADLPKTRSGKIMRRLLRDIAEGKALGDTTTLADPNVVRRLKDEYESLES